MLLSVGGLWFFWCSFGVFFWCLFFPLFTCFCHSALATFVRRLNKCIIHLDRHIRARWVRDRCLGSAHLARIADADSDTYRLTYPGLTFEFNVANVDRNSISGVYLRTRARPRSGVVRCRTSAAQQRRHESCGEPHDGGR